MSILLIWKSVHPKHLPKLPEKVSSTLLVFHLEPAGSLTKRIHAPTHLHPHTPHSNPHTRLYPLVGLLKPELKDSRLEGLQSEREVVVALSGERGGVVGPSSVPPRELLVSASSQLGVVHLSGSLLSTVGETQSRRCCNLSPCHTHVTHNFCLIRLNLSVHLFYPNNSLECESDRCTEERGMEDGAGMEDAYIGEKHMYRA